MSEWAPRRFWQNAEVAQCEGGFHVLLDGREVRTPLKHPLRLPTHALAAAVAQEWQAQEKQVDPASMPVTRAANAAIDKVSVQRAEVADMLSEYGATDLLCYRAEHPPELADRQARAWDPLLAWAQQELGAELRPTRGVVPVAQQDDALNTLRRELHELRPFTLTGLHDLVALSGSLILGLAALRSPEEPLDLWALSRIDEEWQVEQWGRDDEAQKVTERKQQAFVAAWRFTQLSEGA